MYGVLAFRFLSGLFAALLLRSLIALARIVAWQRACTMSMGSVRRTSSFECPSCKEALPSSAQFCYVCGVTTGQQCPTCDTMSPIGARFCMGCSRPWGSVGPSIDSTTPSAPTRTLSKPTPAPARTQSTHAPSPAHAQPAVDQMEDDWEEKIDGRGRVYHINHTKRTTSWTRPANTLVGATLPRLSSPTSPPLSPTVSPQFSTNYIDDERRPLLTNTTATSRAEASARIPNLVPLYAPKTRNFDAFLGYEYARGPAPVMWLDECVCADYCTLL